MFHFCTCSRQGGLLHFFLPGELIYFFLRRFELRTQSCNLHFQGFALAFKSTLLTFNLLTAQSFRSFLLRFLWSPRRTCQNACRTKIHINQVYSLICQQELSYLVGMRHAPGL